MRKPIYFLGLVVVSLFISNCSCDREPDPDHFWVICSMNSNNQNVPALTNRNGKVVYSAQNFRPQDWSCPDTSSSPIWVGSQKPVYGNVPSSSGNAPALKKRPDAGTVSFLPRSFLDLPFIIRPAASETPDLVCDPSQPDVIQVNHDNSSVNRLSTCPFALKKTIPVVSRPLQIAITPDGTTALVTSFDNAVNFIDLASNTVIFTLQTSFDVFPNGIAITPDGTHAYITNFTTGNPSILEIDLTTRQVIATIAVATAYPQSAFISPDGSQLFVTYPYGNKMTIFDTMTNTEAFSLSISAPRGLAFNSKGTKAYISSADNPDLSSLPGIVQEFNTNTFQVTNTYHVGVGPSDVEVLYGDQFVVVNNYEGKSYSVIDTVAGSVQTTALNGRPSGISMVR